jgi:hypothetical protein
MRKVQLYLTEEQYRLLRQRAGERGSVAQVVRDLIDAGFAAQSVEDDPFYQHLSAARPGSGKPYAAEEAKRDLYRRVR